MEEQPTLFLVDDAPSVLDSLRTLAQTLGLKSETLKFRKFSGRW